MDDEANRIGDSAPTWLRPRSAVLAWLLHPFCRSDDAP
jgi:hypothetical protein